MNFFKADRIVTLNAGPIPIRPVWLDVPSSIVERRERARTGDLADIAKFAIRVEIPVFAGIRAIDDPLRQLNCVRSAARIPRRRRHWRVARADHDFFRDGSTADPVLSKAVHEWPAHEIQFS